MGSFLRLNVCVYVCTDGNSNKKAKPESGLENSLLQLVIGSFIVVAFVSMQKNFVLSLTTIDWIPVLLLGLLNTGIGCYLYFSSITDLPVQTVAICGYLEPLSAVVFLYSFYMKSCCLYKCSEPYLYLAAPYLENASSLKSRSGRSKIKLSSIIVQTKA